MKKLLRIGFDIFITGFTPIITWFLIGIIIDKRLTSVFTLTYPLQFLVGIIVAIFGVGANVSKIKDNNKNSADNGIIYGTIISILLFSTIAIFNTQYIRFMNVDPNIYSTFCVYSIFQLLLQTILYLLLNKLYYLEKNKKANKIALIFNLINFITLIATSLITRNQIYTSVVALISLSIFVIVLLKRNINKVDFKINLKNCFKYDSVACSKNILFFIIYLIGFSNSFSFGEKYIVAITFATLITDIQWDVSSAIKTAAKIDIVKNKFNYKNHFRNATRFISLLIASIVIMGLIMYPFYKPNLLITLIFVSLHIIDFIMTPIISIKICYLEIGYSPIITTMHVIIAYIIRTIVSLICTPYCTIIGQMCCSVYELIMFNIIYRKVKKKKNLQE